MFDLTTYESGGVHFMELSHKELNFPEIAGLDILSAIDKTIVSLLEYVDDLVRRYDKGGLILTLFEIAGMGLDSPYFQNNYQSKEVLEESLIWNYLLERVILLEDSFAGDCIQNINDLDEIKSLYALYVHLSTLRAMLIIRNNLSGREINVGTVTLDACAEGGVLKVGYRPGNWRLYQYSKNNIGYIDKFQLDRKVSLDIENYYKNGKFSQKTLQKIDSSMKKELGYGIIDKIDAISYFIKIMRSHISRYPNIGSTFKIEYQSLFRGESINKEALDSLIFNSEYISIQDLDPAGGRRQGARLRTHPLVRVGDEIFFNINFLYKAQVYFIRYLTVGDWYSRVHSMDSYPNLKKSLHDRSDYMGNLFEKNVIGTLRSNGFILSRIKNKAQISNITESCREVDFVLVNPDAKQIIVGEIKKFNTDHGSYSINGSMKTYLDDWYPKVEKTIKQVSQDVEGFCNYVLSNSGHKKSKLKEVNRDFREYSISPIFIVLGGHPACAMENSPVVNFNQLEQLIEVRDFSLNSISKNAKFRK